jgi:DNA-directed RNA polymerase specialized sigma24 family protein
VFDPNAPSSLRALAEFAKASVRKIFLKIAKWSTDGSEADAEDLIAAAMVLVLDPGKNPWLTGTFLTHMSFVMRHVWYEEMRRARVKREIVDEDVTRDLATRSKEPAADEELHRRRSLAVLRTLGEQLIREIGDKFPVAKQVYELGAADIEDAAEQAAIIGCTVEEVHEARRTLKHHAKRIRDEYDLAEERRMKELRERSLRNGPETKP